MTVLRLFLLVLLEGFAALSIEVIALRQLTPFVGNSVVVTSIVIGFFLLFLAIGYWVGGNVNSNFESRLRRNFVIAAAMTGIGLSYMVVATWFLFLSRANPIITLCFYLILVLAPIVFYLGQTIPIVTNLFQTERIGRISGRVLFYSTLGSFVGAIATAAILLSYAGVAFTVLLISVVLTAMAFIVRAPKSEPRSLWVARSAIFLVVVVAIYSLNIGMERTYFSVANEHANYRVAELPQGQNLAGAQGPGKILDVNNTLGSYLGNDGRAWPYIELMKRVIFDDLNRRNHDILVIGAGGFTLSEGNSYANRFTYVDIDGSLKDMVERFFLGRQVRGQFIEADARVFVRTNPNTWDVIVADTYNSNLSLPFHLVTRQYYEDLKKRLRPNGVMLANVVGRATLTDDFSQKLDATIRQVFSSCMVIPLKYDEVWDTNLIYICRNDSNSTPAVAYTDDQNAAPVDIFTRTKAH